MSLIGAPKVQFHDEPTVGLDVVTRRGLFKFFRRLKEISIIISTQRIEEAEVLCDNIAIMLNGRFVVYGTPEYLIAKYGEGYKVMLEYTIDCSTL